MISIKDIYIYPLKSARGIALRHASVDARGLRFDRRWMVVNAEGTFLSQRSHPLLALVDVSIDGMHLRLSARGHGEARLPLYPPARSTAQRRTVVVWDDAVEAMESDRDADEWMSGVLGERCAVVYFPDHGRRKVDPRFARNDEQTTFTDGFPVLVLSQASLDDLNTRLAVPVPMERFRPNIVVEGCTPFAEDTWHTLAVGDTVLQIVKPCARCIITTIDQVTAEKGSEPLLTLSGYRKQDNKVLFGQNALVLSPGSITVGEAVVAATKPASVQP